MKTTDKANDTEEMKKWLRSPTLFVINVLGVKPLRYQAEFLESRSSKILIVSGRQAGKSTMLAWKAIWTAFMRPNQEILIMAPSFDQAHLVYEKVHQAVIQSKFLASHARKLNMIELRFDNGSVIRCITVGRTGDYARGYSASMVIFDEAAVVPEDVYVAMQPTLAIKGEQLILSGTPKGKHGRFWDVYAKETGPMKSGEWEIFKFTTRDNTSNPDIETFLASERSLMTEAQYMQEYEAHFIDEVGAFFPMSLVLENTDDYKYKLYNDGTSQYYMGVDVAHLGLDETAIVIAVKTGDQFRVIHAESLPKADLIMAAGRILEIVKMMPVNKIIVDGIGVGAGLCDILKQSVSDFVEPLILEGGRRLDAYNKIKLLLEQKRLILNRSDMKFLQQFGNFTVKYSTSGNLRIIKESVGHDDLVDALTLAIFGGDVEYRIGILEEMDELFRYRADVVTDTLQTINSGGKTGFSGNGV